MRGKWVLIILGILAVFAIVSIVGNAKIIYVGPSEKYTSIQSAIDNATDGDTIIVRDGIYYENIKVTKRLTIKSENGSDNCIIDGGGKTVVTLKADGITIEGFIIRNSGLFPWDAGIKIHSDNNNIRYNKIVKCGCGIYIGGHSWKSDNNNITYNDIYSNENGICIDSPNDLRLSSNNKIAYNNISNNEDEGMKIYGFNNTITCNRISNNGKYGILLYYSRVTIITNNRIYNDGIFIEGRYTGMYYHIIENNTVNDKPLYYFKGQNGGKVPEDAGGVILVSCSGMIIENLRISNTDIGIVIVSCSQITIRNNNISDNQKHGIVVYFSDNNIITCNNISNNNGNGVGLYQSDNNNITLNRISNNHGHGIRLCGCSNNNVTHNNISNNGKHGIWLDGSDDTRITYNYISLNGDTGIYLDFYSDDNRITRNILSNNRYGIQLCRSRNNNITYNNISNNKKYGIYLYLSSHNSIEKNNFIGNKHQAFFTDGKVSFIGSPLNLWAGNYWDDWKITLPRPIFGRIKFIFEVNEGPPMGAISIRWLHFDWRPATRPYSIG